MTHRWAEPVYIDHTTTLRACKKCPITKVSRHEPDNDPPHWFEWERDGNRFQSTKTPACEESTMAKKPEAPKKSDIRLIELRAENFKKLSAISISPTGGLFEIAGANEQGKSSVLDAFMAAIGGPTYFPPEPIRRGEEQSLLQVNLGDLVVVRRIWHRDGGGVNQEVIIQWADGRRPAKPQTVLNELRGSPIADDPVAFARLKPKDRLDLLKKLVPDVDFDDLAKQRQELFDARTIVGRDHDKAKAVVETMPVEKTGDVTPRNIAELATKLQEANDANAMRERQFAGRELASDTIADLRDQADRLIAQAAAKNLEANELEKKLRAAQPLPDIVDVRPLQAMIASAEEWNEKARKAKERAEKIKERDALSVAYDDLSAEIDALDEQKKTAIAGAKLPVPGLGFGENDITLDGLPFEQASSARRIRVATALLMALKPDIKVLLVREGSLLDEGMREALHEEAVKNDFIVLFETVGKDLGGTEGVIISDGEIL
jgi:hypothetical protein